jgi:hypothetical protein
MNELLDRIRRAQLAQQQGLLSHTPSNRQTPNQVARGMADGLQSMGLLTAPFPVLGDAVGLLGDAAMYASKPEERTWGNAALTALGVLPFVPSVAGKVAKGKKAVDLSPMPQVAERYPALSPGVPTVDPKTGKAFIQKVLSPEAEAVQIRRLAAQRDIDAGNYIPYFDSSKRAHVDPTNYPLPGDSTKVVPKRADTVAKYVAQADTPESRAALEAAYERGSQYPGAENWYAMKQLEDVHIAEFGDEAGRLSFKTKFADPMAATTGGADPTSNLMMTQYGNYQRSQGLPIPAAGHEMPFPIGGRYVTGNMEMYNKYSGGPGFGNDHPKRMNFAGNFMGHRDRATIDEQMMGLFHPGQNIGAPPGDSYGIYEGVVRDLAAKRGIPAQNYQDVAWAGGKTAKDPKFVPRPMIDIVNESIERTHRITGMSKDEIVRRGLVRGEIPLYSVGAGLGLAGLLGSGDQSDQY